ncbi:MAG: hypothetical protein HY816_01755 [Candidatus Wallbacteria bacterium]|nr:hypothetical protein [Candidatus Wallbacteria bacterium]
MNRDEGRRDSSEAPACDHSGGVGAPDCSHCATHRELLAATREALERAPLALPPAGLAEATIAAMQPELRRRSRTSLSLLEWLGKPVSVPGWALAACLALAVWRPASPTQGGRAADSPAPGPAAQVVQSASDPAAAQVAGWTAAGPVAPLRRETAYSGRAVMMVSTGEGVLTGTLRVARAPSGRIVLELRDSRTQVVVVEGERASRYVEAEGEWQRQDFWLEPARKTAATEIVEQAVSPPVAGRAVQLRSERAGSAVTHRWLDRETGMPLRVESRTSDGSVVSFLEFFEFESSPTGEAKAPEVPAESTRMLLAPHEASDAAGPAAALGFLRGNSLL